MANYSSKLADKQFHNWLKTGLALHITKEGLETLAVDEVQQFHRESINDVLTNEQILKGDMCSKCTLSDILPCPTRGICILKSGRCPFHAQSTFRPCPKRICDKLRDKIRNCHKFNFPSWKNTFTEKWCQTPWEIAKCFMPPDGYSRANSAAETDLNGILSFMLNYRGFTDKVDEENCIEAREIGRIFRHSPDLCIKDDAVDTHIDTLLEFLTCTSYLQNNAGARESVLKIQKLKKDALTISIGDINTVLKDVIQENAKVALHSIDQKQSEHLQGISTALSKLQEKTSQTISEILLVKTAAVKDINTSKRAAVSDIHTTVKRAKSEALFEVEKKKEQSVADIRDLAESTLTTIQEHSSKLHTSEEKVYSEGEYQEVMQNLRDDLIEFYQDEYDTIPVSPLVPENDTKLMDFFVQPNMEEVDRNFQGNMKSGQPKAITSFQDIFTSGSDLCQNIYLSAHAGIGKTTFGKRLCLIWCCSKSTTKVKQKLKETFEDEVNAINAFDLLFFIPLRNEQGHECDVDEMIQSQVIGQLSRTHLYKPVFMKELLHRQKCLVILDGLDEWSHPKSTRCRKLSSVPHRRARPEFVVLYTTRPWKLHEAKISSSKINKHIEMKVLKNTSVGQLIENVIHKLNEISDKHKSVEDFQRLIETNDIKELTATPVILTQLVCLWHDDRPIDGSKCQIYISIIEFLLQHGEIKIIELEKEYILKNVTASSEKVPQGTVPSCCKKYYGLITAIGELAFTTLFSQYKESSLVFENAVVQDYLTEDQLWCCLQMGLLTKNKTKTVASRENTVSFIHKTFQEFFCALYIQSLGDIEHIIAIVLNVCDSVEKVLEMTNVFVYLAGLCPITLSVLSQKLGKVVAKDALVTEYRRDVLAWSNWNQYAQPLKELQNMYVSCVKESLRNKQTPSKFYLEDYLFDSDFDTPQYSRCLEQLLDMNKENIKSVNDIRISGRLPKLRQIVDISATEELEKIQIVGEIDKDEFDALSAGSLGSLKGIAVSSAVWEHNRWIPKHSVLSEKTISQIRSMLRLEGVLLECLQLTHDQLEMLIDLITRKKNVRQICLEEITCSTHVDNCCGLELDLSEHNDLTVFEVGSVPLTKIKLNAASLEKCGMGKIESPGVQSAILDGLPKARNLKVFGCFDISCEQDTDRFLNTLSSFLQLQFMVLKRIDLGSKTLELPPVMNSLEYVQMEDMKLSACALKKLIDKVEEVQNSVTVVLRNCEVSLASEYEDMKNYIRSAAGCVVLHDELTDDRVNMFSFKTWGKQSEC